MSQIPVRKGSPKSWLLVLRSADAIGPRSDLAGVYDGTEPLRLRVWPGDDLAARTLPDASVAWGGTDPATGTTYTAADAVVTVTLTGADTPLLSDGDKWVAEVSDGGEWVEFAAGTFAVEDGPGTGTAGRVYCERDDVLDVCPWVCSAQGEGVTVQGSLAEPRALAAQWIDETALARIDARVNEWIDRGRMPTLGWTLTATATDTLSAVLSGVTPRLTARQVVRDAMEADGLIVDDRVRRAAAHYAASVALDPLRFAGTDQAERYRKAATRYWAQAHALLAGAVLRIDVDADGEADIELEY